ncbi:BREX-1 system adenine-specific DNA-methyltransferase PglX [Cupriavidus sp. CuC1]|uniref:BREX-1 system adenine-specific DNA-methyltransferase PglX n=1 Tax=Cupriavidus sp. CuC1 TaxID=3373131 RepID=UPI0037D56A26
METTKLKKFAQHARRLLLEQVGAKLALVLDASSAARRENPQAVTQLEKQLAETGHEQLIDKVAYTWFNRLCALRFMDVNGYTRIRVVSPADEGQFQPEILAEAKMGHLDEDRVPKRSRQQIAALLGGTAPSHDPQQEAYRLLLVAECNSFHRAMPYLFEHIADYTELLMPDDLLSGNSILAYTREAMTPDACQDVEVIGWLYQFYISEKKDQVFEGLKKNNKITPENIPAATQLFTPHWIVRYLVENSLGRLWMLNHPDSSLAGRMEYYIKPETPEIDFLKIAKPEDIKVCDPACGSGHMLTYAFDLLYGIYEEVGTDPSEIPEKILTHNLYGIELDERAGELAAFALTMKARAKQRRFFSKGIEPNICVLEKVVFSPDELSEYIAVGGDLFTLDLRETVKQFEEADNFGSLIRPKLTHVQDVLPLLETKDLSGNLFLKDTHDKVLKVLQQADYLSPKYQVVVANPPYMNAKGMNPRLKTWASQEYPISKSDLMTMFMERATELTTDNSYWGIINIPTWMFLDSFRALRRNLIKKQSIESLLHLGRGVFGSDFGTVAVTFKNSAPNRAKKAIFRRLFEQHVDVRSNEEIERLFHQRNYNRSALHQSQFEEIPGEPFAYWATEKIFYAFRSNTPVGEKAQAFRGISTGDNERFSRYWHEVSKADFLPNAHSREEALNSERRWFPYNRGGSFRKWYGLGAEVIDYQDGGARMIAAHENGETPGFRHDGASGYFLPTITWGALTAGKASFRKLECGYVLGHKGPGITPVKDLHDLILCFLNSNTAALLLEYVSPTLDTNVAHLGSLPLPCVSQDDGDHVSAEVLCEDAKSDWDAYEVSWDFTTLRLLDPIHRGGALAETYALLRAHWASMAGRMQRQEEANNRIFIEAYGLQDELTPEVPLKEITLTCNPHYRYGGDKTEEELEALLLGDTMREFLSYAVGCMFGRYSLDTPGLVLANQDETLADYLRQVPGPRFMPDEDNVIPLLDGEWFADDVTERFREFLRVTFGDAHYEDNLAFIEAALGKDIRKYFLKDFYNDHIKRYKKRPIYWLFSSPKGSFNALIYLHRYRPDTVSVVLRYLRDFRKKLAARLDYLQQVGISASASQGEKTRANKEAETTKKQLLELDDYERDTLYPLATAQVPLDLDDGVKFNYLKLGPALKKIIGLDGKED